jgi:phosphatidylethanolamine/phosphatidyl-N-methylethanolamine N-methyltransferase
MAHQDNRNGTALFFQEMMTSPRQIGAIAPSSKNLSMAMAKWLPDSLDAYVLELGPGTGSVTRALLEKGLNPERLITIEKSPKLADHLRQQFPESIIIEGDALELDSLISQHVPQALPLPLVFSSLPLCNFPNAISAAITAKIRKILRPGGRLIQYSYRLSKRRARSLSNLAYVTSKVVWFNIPPARVSVYQSDARI